jgi:hypothetical protein
MVAEESEQGRLHMGDDLRLRRLPEGVCGQTIADWKGSSAECVRASLFDKKQFMSDEELVMGGPIQKLVCILHLNICGETRARVYWEEEGGKETVRNTFRRKRQAAQNAIKLAFRGEKKYA